MDQRIAGSSDANQNSVSRQRPERKIARSVLLALVAALLAMMAASAAVNWDMVTQPVMEQ